MSGNRLSLAPAAASTVRAEIAGAHGNEVCFLLDSSAEGELDSPRVVARGHSTAVLAAIHGFRAGQVVLHNHPSGALAPSDADLIVAERLWAEGLGFAITNNEASELYVVVPPVPERRAHPLDSARIDHDLAPAGPIAKHHPAYEDREDQRNLARLVGELFSRGGIGLTEAGTGIGKSAAYLIPAIRWAEVNRERTVVSTNTINLQEQLVRKDLPFLRRALGIPFSFALVKGRNNYVSIRRARLATLNAASLLPDARESELRAIAEWVDQTSDGSLSDLPFRPSPEVWDEVVSESDVCLRLKCPHFAKCFYQQSRRDAAAAEILVVNHHLLFSDLAVRSAAGNFTASAVLPHYRRLVLDEAHNLEDTATRHLGAGLTRRGYMRLLRRLEHRGRGILPTFEKELLKRPADLLSRAGLDLIQLRLRPELDGAWHRGAEVFRHLEALASQPESGGLLRLDASFDSHEIWDAGLREDLSGALTHLATLVQGLRTLRERVAVDEEAVRRLNDQLLEIRGAESRIEAAANAFRGALQGEGYERDTVRWIEVRQAPGRATGEEFQRNVAMAVAPLDLGEVLRESLFERVPTVVLTSATLATRTGFAFVRERLGITSDLDVREAVFPSPFDFERQAVLAIPADLPLPGQREDSRHAEATDRIVREFAAITDGGIFVLFTSYRSLRSLASSLRRTGVDSRWPLFVHGEAPRAQLLEQFVRSGRGILLGTDSFWEGVDVPGRPLRGIVIPKLPFKVPTEPITAARVEAIEARGRNAFTTFMLPHAAIRLKQGFGRLIRSRSDRGAVVLLDGRIVNRTYGRYLLESLPPARIVVGTWAECRTELTDFYERSSVTSPEAEAQLS